MGCIENIPVRKIMAKKSKSSVKIVAKESIEETIASVTELNMPTPEGGIIDFVVLFGGLGILMAIIMIIYIILNYVFHIL